VIAVALGLGAQAGKPTLEILAPFLRDAGRVPEVLLVHDLGEAGVGGFENVRIHGIITAFQLGDRNRQET
jgi:hypothetical protein